MNTKQSLVVFLLVLLIRCVFIKRRFIVFGTILGYLFLIVVVAGLSIYTYESLGKEFILGILEPLSVIVVGLVVGYFIIWYLQLIIMIAFLVYKETRMRTPSGHMILFYYGALLFVGMLVGNLIVWLT